MRLTLTLAAFTIVAVHPLTSHALTADAGAAGSSDAAGAAGSDEEAGAGGTVSTATSSGGASAGKGGTGGTAGISGTGGSSGAAAPKPAPNLPDPGTEQPGVSCSLAGPNAPWNLLGTSLALGAACLTLRRRRSR